MTEEKIKTKIPWWIWVLIIILIGMAIGNSEYKDCVKSCAEELDDCSMDADLYGKPTLFCEECSMDLEDCIRWCN